MVSETLVDKLAQDAKEVRIVYWDSMGTVRVAGDYMKKDDALGIFLPDVAKGFYEMGGVLIPKGVVIGVATNGPGFPEVADIFAAITEEKIAKDASIDYTKLREGGPLEVAVNGRPLSIPSYQSIDELTGEEARRRADSGLIVGVSEGGAKGHIFKEGRYIELVLCNQTIPEKLNEINREFATNPETRQYVNKEGIFKADAVFIPLEDGDRTEALIKNRKKVIVVDLNPMSRSAKKSYNRYC